jgi:hypothetical protein
VEDSHPAIIDKDMWEAVQLEMERRKAYVLRHGIKMLEHASLKNPFASRVVCGSCGRTFGRKVWNSTDDSLRRVVWQCSAKYEVKGKKGCNNKHIDDRLLYQAFVEVYNVLVENKEYFMGKWQERIRSGNALERYKARQFIGIIADAGKINEFDIDLYCAFVEKTTVMGRRNLIVSLLDGTDVECDATSF